MARATRSRHAVALVRVRAAGPPLVTLESLARETGLHPEVVLRFVQFGLLAPRGGSAEEPLFAQDDGPLLARAARLRRDLGVNYAGAVLASELLARIEDLERS
jgi:MerR HTH family regulatory protein